MEHILQALMSNCNYCTFCNLVYENREIINILITFSSKRVEQNLFIYQLHSFMDGKEICDSTILNSACVDTGKALKKL